MKRLVFSLIGVLFFLPSLSHAQSEHLQFTFRIHCENDTQCDEMIAEEEEFFQYAEDAGQPAKIDLIIENPKREMITSVRAKLQFDINELSVIDLDTKDSDFTLSAPNENDIDEEEGTVMVGRSLTGGAKSSAEFMVATLTLQSFKNGAALEFLNFQDNELGDTGIFFTSGLTTENRLLEEPKPLLFGSMDAAGGVRNPRGGNGEVQDFPFDQANIPRPTGLRIQTDDQGNVRLIWPIDKNPDVFGYYLYYSQKSGYYLRRRDVGKTNFALFPNLPSGEKYYFSLKAYDEFDQESDYSEEVFVTIGLSGSESHGFSGNPADQENTEEKNDSPSEETEKTLTIKNPNKTVDSGPEHIIFFLIISMGIALMGYSIRKNK